jgi:hypothetical protein
MARPAPPCPIGPHLTNCRLLRDLDVERNSFLLTYIGGDGWRKAGNAEAARAVFNDGGGVLWWRSGSGISSCGSGAARTTSFGAWLSAASFKLARRQWLGLVTGAAMGKSVRGGARVLLFVGQRVQHGRSIVPEIPSNRIEDS